VSALAGGRLRDMSLLREGPLADVMKLLNGGGEETRLVGGTVRDLALEAPPGDFDLATTAPPEAVMARARVAGLRVVPTGLAHGTVTIVAAGLPIEVTTLRQDIETDGRHAEVAFGRDFRLDALRRDFTINALSIDLQGRVHDYADGLADLEARRVRFIGDAHLRIREDYLRILRFFRFSARFGEGELDAEGFAATIREREGLAILSRERVRVELLKLLAAPRAGEVVTRVCEAGLLAGPLAGMADPARLRRLLALEAARGEPPDPLLRLAALAVQIEEDAERLRERLRLSNGEYDRLATLARALETLHGTSAPPSLGDLRLLLFERGRQGARDAIALSQVDCGAAPDDERFSHAWRFVSDTPQPRLPFSGADIVARGVGPGQRVGVVLKNLQALWIRAGFPREPEALARLMDEALRE
jgi:tRNA nucleotidyltransferase/poly(A) polymerase